MDAEQLRKDYGAGRRMFCGVILHGENLREIVLSGADLREADLGEADLRGADLLRARLGRADLRYARVDGCDLRQADLTWAVMDHATLRGARLEGAVLCGASLHGVNLAEASLAGADLTNANLSDADLRGADLSRARMGGANISCANLEAAKLAGADFGAPQRPRTAVREGPVEVPVVVRIARGVIFGAFYGAVVGAVAVFVLWAMHETGPEQLMTALVVGSAGGVVVGGAVAIKRGLGAWANQEPAAGAATKLPALRREGVRRATAAVLHVPSAVFWALLALGRCGVIHMGENGRNWLWGAAVVGAMLGYVAYLANRRTLSGRDWAVLGCIGANGAGLAVWMAVALAEFNKAMGG